MVDVFTSYVCAFSQCLVLSKVERKETLDSVVQSSAKINCPSSNSEQKETVFRLPNSRRKEAGKKRTKENYLFSKYSMLKKCAFPTKIQTFWQASRAQHLLPCSSVSLRPFIQRFATYDSPFRTPIRAAISDRTLYWSLSLLNHVLDYRLRAHVELGR